MPEYEDDLLTAQLNRSGSTPPPEPPAAFLRAVHQRRRARRVRQGSMVILGLLLLSPMVWLLRWPAPAPQYADRDGTGNASQHPLHDSRLAGPEATLLEVMSLNRDGDPALLVLPDVPLGRSARVLRVVDTLDAEAALDRM